MIHKGGCHCGAVRFEVEAPADLQVTECNCSICSRSGYLHLIVTKQDFRLISGADALTTYSFDTHEARHLFCRTCGIKSSTIRSMTVKPFDGRHWEANIAELRKTDP